MDVLDQTAPLTCILSLWVGRQKLQFMRLPALEWTWWCEMELILILTLLVGPLCSVCPLCASVFVFMFALEGACRRQCVRKRIRSTDQGSNIDPTLELPAPLIRLERFLYYIESCVVWLLYADITCTQHITRVYIQSLFVKQRGGHGGHVNLDERGCSCQCSCWLNPGFRFETTSERCKSIGARNDCKNVVALTATKCLLPLLLLLLLLLLDPFK